MKIYLIFFLIFNWYLIMDKIKVDSVLGVRNNYRICGGRIESRMDRYLKLNLFEVFLFYLYRFYLNIILICNYLFVLL